MKNCLVLLLLIFLRAQLFSQPNPLQRLHYTIDVKLDDKDHSLDGFMKLNYTNLSADTLHYLWFQLWPNAFKNDRTAYSEHMLDAGSTRFYFSDKKQRGYINRLVFRSGNEVLVQEDHPQYGDIIKVYLADPLAPDDSVNISTPFHVQLPYYFSGFGHMGHQYHLQNWYPSVALFGAGGWQPKPFVGQQQELLSDYDVTVTLPKKYVLQTQTAILDSSWADTLKRLTYHAEKLNDFAWSAEIQGTKHPAPKKSFDERIDEAIPKIISKKILPAIGYNVYDGFQIGAVLQNFGEPGKLTYLAAPMYGTASKTITGFAGINYNIYSSNYFKKISIGFNASKFSSSKGTDSLGGKVFGGFGKFAPYVRLSFPSSDKHNEQWIEFRTFLIGEKEFDYVSYSVDSFYYPAEGTTKFRYLNQLTFNHTSYRALYPWNAQVQVQQASNFYRVNGEARYFFNYSQGGGLKARIFAAKFGYIGKSSSSGTYRYQPKLTAVTGEEDYTYSNAFVGRNEFSGFPSQQMMMRDGGLKLRTDMFLDLQGRSDNWVAAMNLSTTLPPKIFSAGFPLKIFFDAGTYAAAWEKGSAQPRFLYVSGLQLNLFRNILNVYAPVLYSKTFKDNLKTVPEENTFFKKISFSVDIGNLLTMRTVKQ